ncbi:MAG: hypothetical protein OEZ54_10770 [Gemmatimonadota bacterium]|nr:hypothetical protein [Gemmatimonadota bacterium]
MLTRTSIFWLILPLGFLGPKNSEAQAFREDQGVLRIFRDGIEIGREDFSITAGATNAAGQRGSRLVASVAYPPRRTSVTLGRRVEFGADSQPQVVQFESSRPDADRVVAQFGERRLTIRTISRTEESAQEHPRMGRYMVVDDSSFSLYALPPSTAPGPITLFWVRQGFGETFQLQNMGVEQTTVDGRPVSLTHIVLRSDEDSRHIWYDERGRLTKVEIPKAGITAERTIGATR